MIEHCPLTTMELPAMDPWMDAADGRGDGAADVSGGDAPGGDEPGGVSQAVTAKRTRRGDAPVSDGAAGEGAAGDMEQAAMEQTAMKQTAMERAAMAMRQGQWPIRREARCQLGSDRRALVARLPTLSLAEFPMATDNNSNNASFPLARRCCYGKNARSMADASFAAMAGVTAADHGGISKI